ncbi:MAG: DUF3253 domain-containing protein [Ilumatobacteraceae bacterium]
MFPPSASAPSRSSPGSTRAGCERSGVEVVQRGRVVDPSGATGAIRVRRPWRSARASSAVG